MGQGQSRQERAFDAAGLTFRDAVINLELLLQCFDDQLHVTYLPVPRPGALIFHELFVTLVKNGTFTLCRPVFYCRDDTVHYLSVVV